MYHCDDAAAFLGLASDAPSAPGGRGERRARRTSSAACTARPSCPTPTLPDSLDGGAALDQRVDVRDAPGGERLAGLAAGDARARGQGRPGAGEPRRGRGLQDAVAVDVRRRGPARCGCSAASVSGRTGATHASVPSKTSVHSAWVRSLNRRANASRSAGHWARSSRSGSVGEPEQLDEHGVELRLQRADRHVPAVGGLVDVVERRAAVEQVRRRAARARSRWPACPRTSPTGAPCRPRSPRPRPAPAPLARASRSAASTPITRYVDPPPKSPSRLVGNCGRSASCPRPCSAPAIEM